jgi:hypothetical protein
VKIVQQTILLSYSQATAGTDKLFHKHCDICTQDKKSKALKENILHICSIFEVLFELHEVENHPLSINQTGSW